MVRELEWEAALAWEDQAKSFGEMFKRFGESLHMPQMDIDAVMESHRKNIEALEQSARASAAGAASLFTKQKEAVEQGMRDASEMAQSFSPAGSPQAAFGKQADLAKRSFEAAVKNAGEMAEIIRQSGTESTEILRNRIRDSMEEAMKRFSPQK